jgi:hypothetical protein
LRRKLLHHVWGTVLEGADGHTINAFCYFKDSSTPEIQFLIA